MIILIPALFALFVFGLVIRSFFVHRHAESDVADASWTSTEEVFRDPSTARLMRVWLDSTGARHYVTEGRLGREP